MKELLKELDEIRQDKNFIKYGFAEKGGHIDFIKKAKRLSRSQNRFISERAKLIVMIAYAYVTSRGLKTDNTIKLCHAFNDI